MEQKSSQLLPSFSIPSFDLKGLPQCNSQDELEAELAKCVGLSLSAAEGDELPEAAPETSSGPLEAAMPLLAVLSDAGAVQSIAQELRSAGAAPCVSAGLCSLHRQLSKAAETAVAAEVAALVGGSAWGTLEEKLHSIISASLSRQQRNFPSQCQRAQGPGAPLPQLWRRLKQVGWLPAGSAPARKPQQSRNAQMISDISAAVESQLSRAKEAASTMELLREQAREARLRASSSEERSSKAMAEIQRLRRALQAKNERINHLESELASDAMAGFGDVAAQLGNVREELDVVRAEADHLAKANSELRAELEEARDRQQAAEAERCDAIQRLEHSEEERRELLEFQSMAADAIREKEVRALERRIRELESPREPAPQAPTLGQASTQASHTRARIEAAVAKDATYSESCAWDSGAQEGAGSTRGQAWGGSWPVAALAGSQTSSACTEGDDERGDDSSGFLVEGCRPLSRGPSLCWDGEAVPGYRQGSAGAGSPLRREASEPQATRPAGPCPEWSSPQLGFAQSWRQAPCQASRTRNPVPASEGRSELLRRSAAARPSVRSASASRVPANGFRGVRSTEAMSKLLAVFDTGNEQGPQPIKGLNIQPAAGTAARQLQGGSHDPRALAQSCGRKSGSGLHPRRSDGGALTYLRSSGKVFVVHPGGSGLHAEGRSVASAPPKR